MKVLSVLLAVLFGNLNLDDDIPTYEQFKTQQGITYETPDEDQYRASVYAANVMSIRANNNNPKSTHKEGVNRFALLTHAEFVLLMLNPIRTPKPFAGTPTLTDTWSVTSVDWTATGAVTSVKDQGMCGCGWAFSAVASMESASYLKDNITLNLSEQQLVSCAIPAYGYSNRGCSGGNVITAYNYTKGRGLNNESVYPYASGTTGTNGTCVKNFGFFKIASYGSVAASSCSSVATTLLTQPLAVTVDAANWSAYSSGVFSSCSTIPNHYALLVGVTSDQWKIKNSWGVSWGESGYIRLVATGGVNTCGVCGAAVYPTK